MVKIAENLKNRNDVINLKIGDCVQVEKNGFKVEVEKIICASGGDMCIMGKVISYMPHPYFLPHGAFIYGTKVIWGPKGICCSIDILDYIHARRFVKRV